MPHHCEFPTCDAEQSEDEPEVVVSLSLEEVEVRRTCLSCNEVYTSGLQHGRYRAIRLLLQRADELSRSGAHAEAACYRLAAEVIDCVDDPAEEVRPSGAVGWRWAPPEPR
jgi:hypothetical protein